MVNVGLFEVTTCVTSVPSPGIELVAAGEGLSVVKSIVVCAGLPSVVTDMIGEELSEVITVEVGELLAVFPVVEKITPSGTVYTMLGVESSEVAERAVAMSCVEPSEVMGRAVDVTLSEEVVSTGLGVGLVVIMPADVDA